MRLGALPGLPILPGAAVPAPTGPTPRASRPSIGDYAFVPMEIACDTITFADGQRCAVLACSGVNVAALDTEQQRALHTAYYAALLGLTVPLQILVCADPVDLGPYAARRAGQSHLEYLRMPHVKQCIVA